MEENEYNQDPVLDGSILAIAYSGSKKPNPLEYSACESDPIQMVRMAMHQLSILNDNPAAETVDQIQTLLQGVEEYLEENTRLQSSVKRRLATKFSHFLSPSDDFTKEPMTPVLDRFDYSKHKSIAMENQLDLNESEIDYFEEIINDLAERLEKMKEERDELQSITNSLGDRLQRISREKDEQILELKNKFAADANTLQHENEVLKDRETKLLEQVQILSLGLKQSEDTAKMREASVVNNFDYGSLLDSKNEKIRSQTEQTEALQILVEDERGANRLLKARVANLEALQKDNLAAMSACVTHISENLKVSELHVSDFGIFLQPKLNIDFDFALSSIQKYVHKSTDLLNKMSQENIELRIQSESLNGKFHAKSSSYDQMYEELHDTRKQLDLQCKVIDELRLLNLKLKADSQINDASLDNQIELLKTYCKNLEAKTVDFAESIKLKDIELANERERSQSYLTLVEKLGEKDDTTEELLSKLKAENFELKDELTQTHDILKIKCIEAEQLIAKLDVCESENTELRSQLDDVKQKFRQTEDELDTNKEVFTQFKLDVTMKLNHFNNIVETLTKQNGSLKHQLDVAQSKSEWSNQEIQLREEVNEKYWSDMHLASSILIQYKNSFEEAFKFMEDSSLKALNSFEYRINKMCSRIDVFQREFSKLKSNYLSKDSLKVSFEETQQSLKDAVNRRLQDEQLINELQDQLLSLQSEYIACEEALREMQSKSRNKDQYANEGVSARLTEAEHRAEEMASEQAKMFAQSSRIIAYLEGENSRLKNMCDHFRMANSKLMVELKGSLYAELKLKTAENKLKTAHEIEDASRKRLKQYEELLNQKNEEYSRNLTLVHSEYRDKMLQLQSDYDRACDAISELKITVSKAASEKESVSSQLASLKSSSDSNVRDHRKKCEQYESELISMRNLVEDVDYECKMLRETIQELTMTNSQYEMKLSILSQEFQEYKLSGERLSHDVGIELQEKSQKISALESEILTARAKQIEAESNALMLSEEVTKTLLKRVGTEDEIRLLRENIESCKVENSKVHQINTNLKLEIQKAHVEIETLNQKLSNLENNLLPGAIGKTQMMEKQISDLESQLRIARNDLELTKQQLERSKSDVNSSEVLIQDLKNKLNALYSEEQLLKTSNETLTEDNQMLQLRLHSMLEKIQYLEERNSHLRKDIDGLTDSNISLETQLAMEKNKSKSLGDSTKVIEELLHEVNGRLSEATNLLLSATSTDFNGDFEIVPFDKLFPNMELIPILTECNSCWEEFHRAMGLLLMKSHSLRSKLDVEISHMETFRKVNEELKYSNEKLLMENEELTVTSSTTKGQIQECERSLNSLEEQVGTLRMANMEINRKLSSMCNDKSLWLRNIGEKISATFESLGTGSTLAGQVSLTSVNYDTCVSNDTLAIFNSFTSEIETNILLWMQIIDSIHNTCREAQDESASLQNTIDSKELKWNEEKVKLNCDLNIALSENSMHLQTINELKSLIDGQCIKLNDLNNALEEISKNNAELEQEFHITADLNSQLKQSIAESDTLINELKTVIRSHEAEIENKIILTANLQDQLVVFRKRVMDFESLNERNNSLINRLKFEKDALDNVRKSLESEVERHERTKHQLLEEASQSVSIEKFVLDFETSVCIIYSTVSQIEEQLHLKSSVDTSLVPNENVGSAELSHTYSKIMNKSQMTLEKLGLIRTALREEEKYRKTIDGKLLSATQQVDNLNDTLIKLKAQYKSLEEEKTALNSQNVTKLDEIDKLRSALTNCLHEKEDMHKAFSQAQESMEKYSKEVTELNRLKDSKESDIKGLTYELELREHTIGRLREELNSEKLSQKNTLADLDQKCAQYEAIKNSNHNLLLTVQHLEQSLSLEKQSTMLLEIKDKEIESLKLANCDLTNELENTKFQLEKAAREKQVINDSKIQAEKNTVALGQELDAMKKHSAMLELRMDIILQEKNSFLDEINETRRKIQIAKESFELEKVQRLKSEATAEALKRAHGEDRKKLFSELNTLQLDFQNNSHDDEIRALKSKLQHFELELIDKDSKIKYHQEERKLLIKEIEASQVHLNKKSEELLAATSYSNMLRQEGKAARKKSLEILGVLKEMYQTINLDLKMSVEFGHDTVSLSNFSLESTETLNLCDTLGLNDILNSSNMLREVLPTYRSEFRRLRSVFIQWETTEAENGSLRRKLNDVEKAKAEAEHRYDDNVKLLQQQIFQLRNIESQYLQANHHIASLESALARERESKEASLIQLSALKSQLGDMQIVSNPIVHDNSILVKEIDSLKLELEKIAKVNDELAQEIDAINFHRTVLKNTIEEMEQKMFDRIEQLLQVELGNISNETDLEKLKREVVRTRTKSKVVEDLSQIYRTGILALYSDGTSYSAAQFGWQPFSSKQEYEIRSSFDYITPGVGWIEREIFALYRSFDEELRVLNDFVSELYTKLKHSQKYSLELRKQFEDHMKAIYSVGKDGTSSIVIRQLEKMRIELEESQKIIFSLEDDLQQELLRSQNGHATLVNEISNALQCRDSALLALKKLELFCKERNFPIGELFGVYKKLKSQYVTNVSVTNNTQQLLQHEIHGNDTGGKVVNEKRLVTSVKKSHQIEKDPRQNREMHLNSSYMLRTVDSTAGASTLRISRSKHK